MNAYILIGGRSWRMGEPKEALRIGGETFLQHVASVAGESFERVIAVQRADGADAGMETIFESPHEDEAPVFGVARALEHARERCFVIAVDYPLLTTAALRHLRECFERSQALLLAPRWNGKVQMLCAGYSDALLPRIEQRMSAKRYDLRGLAGEVEAEILSEEDLRKHFAGEPLMNVNTPKEFEQAIRRYKNRDQESE